MLEIRPAEKGFILFDTDEQEPIMRFDTKSDAAVLIAELAADFYNSGSSISQSG